MIKQDWLDYFEAVNGRSATEAEIAQALAAGEFQEEQVAQEASQFVGAPVAPEQANAGFVAAPAAPEGVTSQFAAAPEAPVFGAQQNSFQQAPQQQPQPGFGQLAPGQGFQQAPYPGQPQPGQSYYSQPSQFGIAVGGYWNWFLSALKRPSAEYNTKALNGILHYVLTAFVLTLATFFTASGFTGGYGMDFRAFMLTLISMFFTIYAFQVTGFFVRRVVLQDKEYSYGRSFEEFGRLSVYNLPLALLAFLAGLIKVYEFYGLVNYLIFLLFFVGTCYVVHLGLNKSSLKADRFLLLVASSIIVFLIAIFVLYVNARILEQVAAGFIPNTPSFSNFRF